MADINIATTDVTPGRIPGFDKKTKVMLIDPIAYFLQGLSIEESSIREVTVYGTPLDFGNIAPIDDKENS